MTMPLHARAGRMWALGAALCALGSMACIGNWRMARGKLGLRPQGRAPFYSMGAERAKGPAATALAGSLQEDQEEPAEGRCASRFAAFPAPPQNDNSCVCAEA